MAPRQFCNNGVAKFIRPAMLPQRANKSDAAIPRKSLVSRWTVGLMDLTKAILNRYLIRNMCVTGDTGT
jgi:hypothetical protein